MLLRVLPPTQRLARNAESLASLRGCTQAFNQPVVTVRGQILSAYCNGDCLDLSIQYDVKELLEISPNRKLILATPRPRTCVVRAILGRYHLLCRGPDNIKL